MKKKNIKVAVIDNAIDTSVYTPVAHWKSWLNLPWESFRAPKNRFPNLRREYTHLILTGSEASILERERWVEEEVEVVREAYEKGLAILGSCYGHQLLALALRSAAQVRRCPHPEIGWIPVEVLKKNALLGDKKTFYTFSSHFDEVTNLDDEFIILASTPACPVQGFKLRRKPVWGIQGHPEIDIPSAAVFLKKIMNLRLKTHAYFEKAWRESMPHDSGLILRIVRVFLGLDG